MYREVTVNGIEREEIDEFDTIDLDKDGEVSREEVMIELSKRGVEFKKNAKTSALVQLLAEQE